MAERNQSPSSKSHRFLRSASSLSNIFRPNSRRKEEGTEDQDSNSSLRASPSIASLRERLGASRLTLRSFRSKASLREEDFHKARIADPNFAEALRRPGLTFIDGRMRADSKVNPYPLPIDTMEVNRQQLFFQSVLHVLGRKPYCSPHLNLAETQFIDRPRQVLDVACGSGTWSHMCNDYFNKQNIWFNTFHGIDLYNLSPALDKLGVDFRFVEHDIRSQTPLPFPDNHFDFIFLKNVSLITPINCTFLEKYIALLRPGGTIEVWDTDYKFRTLTPNPSPAPGLYSEAYEQADKTKTYTVFSGTPWEETENPTLKQYNAWVEKAFDKRGLLATPCATMSDVFIAESDLLEKMGNRRVAIPLGITEWERKAAVQEPENPFDPNTAAWFTKSQYSVRKAFLDATIHMIGALEPLLKDAAGKEMENWDAWLASMTNDLQTGKYEPPCVEIGAWWAQKRKNEEEPSEPGPKPEVLTMPSELPGFF